MQKPQTPDLDAQALLDWYDRHARTLPWRVGPMERAAGVRPDPYAVWLSEIMLQQTTVRAVADYFRRFLARWPTVEHLAAAPLDDVLVAWAGLGYYARARNLHTCARSVCDEYGGTFPKSAIELRALPGIGPYTAAAIAAICFDERVAVIDGNVERVMARYLALDKPVRLVKTEIRDAVQAVVPTRAGDFAQAMMDLGASLCAPRSASCMLCPIQPGCAAAATGAPTDYPVPAAKPERPTRYGHAFIITNGDGQIWLRQRPEKGLLAKMTEVPTSAWIDASATPQFPLATEWEKIGEIAHVFTHFRLELIVWKTNVGEAAPLEQGWWAHRHDLAEQALPSLFKKVLASGGFQVTTTT